jgi:hypothetical protein
LSVKLLSQPPGTTNGELSASAHSRALAWLGEFREKAGRPLKVLHIGNIANNAYNNAKIQRKYGIEADVLCYDCHIMARPEDRDLIERSAPDLDIEPAPRLRVG